MNRKAGFYSVVLCLFLTLAVSDCAKQNPTEPRYTPTAVPHRVSTETIHYIYRATQLDSLLTPSIQPNVTGGDTVWCESSSTMRL